MQRNHFYQSIRPWWFWACVAVTITTSWLVQEKFASAQTPNLSDRLRCDPTKVLTADSCARCHANEVQVWQQTPHFRTFESMHRDPRAQQIAERMGLRSIKRSDVCINCHYTMQEQGGNLRAVSGISCESCHGAALDWLEIHNDYGGPTATKGSESAAHRQQRVDKSIQRGMRNPNNVYLIARSCLECHTVPHEELVNVGGHKSGSVDFELVSWSQGRLRHNFSRTDGRANATNPIERIRVMYVVGLIAELEFSTRATSKATKKAEYGLAVANRAAKTATKLYEIQQQINDPILEQVLVTFAEAELRLNNQQQLLTIAERISDLGFEFAQAADGSKLAAIDHLIPKPEQYK
ncbi:MAG TPA: cytochrome c family protein [Pirellulaceae bacterium]|nr:cytochrome c family protein [Pirellulaceae bacterium]HMO94179.1 cytochrome c family protein [Pirellulaceae bacterium]HMP71200.1 cytochrome c family protein [Pirellulaceae bacterium]